MGSSCKCGEVCEEIGRWNHDLRKYPRKRYCPTQKYYVFELGTGAGYGATTYQDVLDKTPAFDTWEEAEQYAADYQCASCMDCISKGQDPRATCCYSLVCITSGRYLRREANGTNWRQLYKTIRRQHDKNYKRRRKR